jgi:SAM-dependent methyltransferase
VTEDKRSLNVTNEVDEVRKRYDRRRSNSIDWRYNLLNPAVWQMVHERQRALLRLLHSLGWQDLSQKCLLEVGCGNGSNLLEMLRFGFDPRNLQGVELLEDRYAEARRMLPTELQLNLGDACEAKIQPGSQDIVLQSTVFSSLLDDVFQQRLADAMWRWVKPGGGVLWYDFTINNPHNADVRGVPLQRVRSLFPEGRVQAQRVTLAPPAARQIVRVHPSLYHLLNAVPLLRTHVLAWIEKPQS